MAIDFSKLNFFNRLDARARVFVLLAGVVGFILIIYLITRLFSSDTTTGTARIAAAPAGVQAVPGGTQNPEYERAIQQASVQRAESGQLSGTSAIPTLMYTGQQGCVVCPDQTANVKYKLDEWATQGRIAPDVAQELQQLADRGVSEAEYAARLNDLVRQGKLTPEQARELLEAYRKQHANRLLAESAKMMDPLIKSGQLPLDVANELLDAQRRNMSPSDYANLLQRLVKEGRISPAVAQQLLAQYSQQRAKEIILRSIVLLQQMSSNGEITPDVLKELINLESNMVPLDAFTAAVQKYVSQGKMIPAVGTKIIDEYRQQREEIGPGQTINQLLQQAEAAAYQELSDLLKAGRITPDVASQIAGMIQRNVSLDEFQKAITALVQQNKLTPEIAQLKYQDYQKVKGLRDLAATLSALQANNASAADYAEALKRAVQAGLITPEEAARLMQDYLAMTARPAPAAGQAATAEFARLQQQLQQGAVPTAPPATEFTAAQTQVVQETSQDRAQRIAALLAAMSAQAQQLVAAWQPVPMVHKEGSFTITTAKTTTEVVAANGGGPDRGPPSNVPPPTGVAPLIKAGTILFAVLDTAVNSDYPDTPVMATIVEGRFKGAKLLGKMQTTKGVAGQLDRVSLTFTLMNEDIWPTSKSITAYAIDPDTARTVMASEVNYHYLLRFGAIMATSFLQGYATAITTSSSTTTTGIFGTSTTHPSLSPGQKLAVALGQVGQTLGSVTQNWVNIPPTVKVDPGVGLGILFMSDVAA